VVHLQTKGTDDNPWTILSLWASTSQLRTRLADVAAVFNCDTDERWTSMPPGRLVKLKLENDVLPFFPTNNVALLDHMYEMLALRQLCDAQSAMVLMWFFIHVMLPYLETLSKWMFLGIWKVPGMTKTDGDTDSREAQHVKKPTLYRSIDIDR
jgi:hypothetical protein